MGDSCQTDFNTAALALLLNRVSLVPHVLMGNHFSITRDSENFVRSSPTCRP